MVHGVSIAADSMLLLAEYPTSIPRGTATFGGIRTAPRGRHTGAIPNWYGKHLAPIYVAYRPLARTGPRQSASDRARRYHCPLGAGSAE